MAAPALFYHLTRSEREAVAGMLAARAAGQGWRVFLRAPAADLPEIDRRLWLGPKEGFLAHGLAGGAQDARQPLLLGEGAVPPGRFEAVMVLGGAEATAQDAAGRERLWILFDGEDPAALERARGQWRALAAAGLECQYWTEGPGGWSRAR